MASNLLANASYYAPTPALEPDERERLILENLSHVRWVAMRIHEKIGGVVGLDDLVSAGVIGLINAVDSYDPKFNVKLKTYAEHRIRGAIFDSIRGLDGVPVHKRKRLKEIEAAIAAAEQRLQRVPGEEEIATELNMPRPSIRTFWPSCAVSASAAWMKSPTALPKAGCSATSLRMRKIFRPAFSNAPSSKNSWPTP